MFTLLKEHKNEKSQINNLKKEEKEEDNSVIVEYMDCIWIQGMHNPAFSNVYHHWPGSIFDQHLMTLNAIASRQPCLLRVEQMF